MTHELKIQSHYLEQLLSGEKKAEIRYNDRNYQKGDVLEFAKEVYPSLIEVKFRITNVLWHEGLKEGYVILSVEKI